MAKKFPNEAYVYRVDAGTPDECLLVTDDLGVAADEERQVGVYRLQQVVTVKPTYTVRRKNGSRVLPPILGKQKENNGQIEQTPPSRA